MKTKEELKNRILYLEEIKKADEEKIGYLEEVIEDYEKQECMKLDSSNLMEQQKAELLVKAQKRFTLQELEEKLGGNYFTL